jgi:uncharacterized membrane protein YdfJ with MMPL/SSD domain
MSADDPNFQSDGAGTALTRALARRERHRRRALGIRALTFAALALLVAVAVTLFLRLGFLPLLFVPAVIALLALEFRWAARALAWGLERLARFVRRVRRVVRGRG